MYLCFLLISIDKTWHCFIQQVDASNIYGLTEENRQLLRLGQGGKLKFQVRNGMMI